jgi:hypothetical protein
MQLDINLKAFYETQSFIIFLISNFRRVLNLVYFLLGISSVLSSLIHRARALCDQDSHSQELDFLTTIFKQNGYNDHQIRAIKPARQTSKPDEKPTTTAYLPHINNTYGRLS